MNDTIVGLLVGSVSTLIGVFVPQVVQAWREEWELAKCRRELMNQVDAARLRIVFLSKRR